MSEPDIVAFIEARLDEDEQVARAVEDRSAPFDGQWKNDDNRALRTYNDWVLAYKPNAEPWAPGVLDHIARHDPARVLAEITAKRRVLARHHRASSPEYVYRERIPIYMCEGCEYETAYGFTSARTPDINQCPELRDAASVWSDHPDFDEAWRC